MCVLLYSIYNPLWYQLWAKKITGPSFVSTETQPSTGEMMRTLRPRGMEESSTSPAMLEMGRASPELGLKSTTKKRDKMSDKSRKIAEFQGGQQNVVTLSDKTANLFTLKQSGIYVGIDVLTSCKLPCWEVHVTSKSTGPRESKGVCDRP